MLRNIVQLSFRSIHSAKLSRTVTLRSTIKCTYARWAFRRPVKIVNEEELLESDDIEKTVVKTYEKTPKIHKNKSKTWNEKNEKTKEKKVKEKMKVKEEMKIEDNEETTKKTTTGPIYKSLSADDKLISSLLVDIKTRKKREKNNLMLLEGFRLIQDAIEANLKPKVIFFSRFSDIQQLSLPEEVKLYKIPYRTIQLWSNLTTSPGILGIFDIPDVHNIKPANDAIPLTIICDNIREPGNLGTIVRAAAAVGCEKLLLMKGCVDLWESKVLRSAVGAHFRLPIFTSLSWDEVPTLISNESAVFLTDNNIMYTNKLKDHTVNPESDININTEDNDDMKKQDSNVDIDEIENDLIKQSKPNEITTRIKLLVKKTISQLPVTPYYALDFTQKEIVLIVGGETEGVSLESCKLLRERNCVRVNVPLTNGIESLNVGVAVGIVTFEMKRQFINRNIDDE